MKDYANSSNETPMYDSGSGWVTFAGILMVMAGFFHTIAGIIALAKPSLYVTTNSNTFLFDYNHWGWTHIIFGVILMLSASSLYAGKMWGRIVAITMATISAIVNFSFIWASPVWSISIIVLDVMIIYGVAMYGGLGRNPR